MCSIFGSLRFDQLTALEKAASVSELSFTRFSNPKSHAQALYLRIIRVYNMGTLHIDPESQYILLSRVKPLADCFLDKRKWADENAKQTYATKLEGVIKDAVKISNNIRNKLRNYYEPRSESSQMVYIKHSELMFQLKGSVLVLDLSTENRHTCWRFDNVFISQHFITPGLTFYGLLMHIRPQERGYLVNITDYDNVVIMSDQESTNYEYVYNAIECDDSIFRPRNPPVLCIKDNLLHEGTCCRKMRIGVLTVSDTCKTEPEKDKSGPVLLETLKKSTIIQNPTFSKQIVEDNVAKIKDVLLEWSKTHDVILTTGGTGFTHRDVTPEATRAVIEKPCPGIVVALVQEGLKHTAMAALSRPEAGICNNCLVVNLPGSPKACQQSIPVLEPILNHAVQLLRPEASHSEHPN
ncbi:unnamed protein product [Bursaphelenchus okinawaensis]|uniref:molybdopterin molybdotransferase n=1 Tax=Bursaphelenchus okinawaensis TaxID=465554 RepID=A0A811L6U7_9BILA|nr:unnamed protein product [Bursaphelenchus okinawaensis]CAG9119198.1 unnamed protein product [Bursaphelenchus okinawaensis]